MFQKKMSITQFVYTGTMFPLIETDNPNYPMFPGLDMPNSNPIFIRLNYSVLFRYISYTKAYPFAHDYITISTWHSYMQCTEDLTGEKNRYETKTTIVMTPGTPKRHMKGDGHEHGRFTWDRDAVITVDLWMDPAKDEKPKSTKRIEASPGRRYR
jgi:hypothetical protein